MLELKHISYRVTEAGAEQTILDDVSVAIPDGKLVVFTGPNGNSIFMPASGCLSYENNWEGLHGLYWLNSTENNNWNGDPAADYFELDCQTVKYCTYRAPRCWGLTIRAVIDAGK